MSINEQNETFTITVTMRKRWVPHFLGMLKRMQYLGGIGASRKVAIYSDGDGDFRPKFSWPNYLPEPAAPKVGADDRDNVRDQLFDAG